MEEKVLMTKNSLEKLEEEIRILKTDRMRECLSDLADAKDKGDIAENAEYDIAMEMLENLQMKIKSKESTLRRVVIIDDSNIDTSKVGILTKVTVENLSNNTITTYSIVPENEIDIKQSKISPNSPLAKCIMHKNVGDIVDFNAPVATFKLKILTIETL